MMPPECFGHLLLVAGQTTAWDVEPGRGSGDRYQPACECQS